MKNFADRLIEAIKEKGNPCMVGLDPRIEQFPHFIFSILPEGLSEDEKVEQVLIAFNTLIIETIKDIIPTVKIQSAFYEQYGIAGMKALQATIKIVKNAGLVVVVDAKRNDIGSTAEAYANTFLPIGAPFEADALTVSPFLGRDSLVPFVEACKKFGKGLFILVKTSNEGSGDLQNQILKETNEPLYISVAKMVNELGVDVLGESGYSAIGAVVGATHPKEIEELRTIMPKAIFLVPGYGAQGGTGADTKPAFNADKLGAVVSASRSINFPTKNLDISKEDFINLVQKAVEDMVGDVALTLK